MGAHERLALIASLTVTLGIGGAVHAWAQFQPPFDHLKCYKIKDPLRVKHRVDLVPEQTPFLTETGCTIKSPGQFLCTDVQKTHVQPPPQGPPVQGESARDYLCYKLTCPRTDWSIPIQDQFGSRTVIATMPKMLCAPAERIGAPPRATPTPCLAPTPTPTPLPCGLAAGGACNGDCPPGDLCLFDADLGNCTCAPAGQGCTVSFAGPPVICAGLCPQPGDRCVLTPGTSTCQCSQPCGATGASTCGGYCPPSQVCTAQPGGGCLCQGTLAACNLYSPGMCGGDCGPYGNPTYQCLFDPNLGSCQCMLPSDVCAFDNPPGSATCGGLCADAPGSAGALCIATGPTSCDCR